MTQLESDFKKLHAAARRLAKETATACAHRDPALFPTLSNEVERFDKVFNEVGRSLPRRTRK
jgi:DNA primase